MLASSADKRQPAWFWAVASLGLLWNVFGVFQFLGTVNKTTEMLTAQGMTNAQATLYSTLPFWMTAAFALGVFGGVLGCVLLLIRSKFSKPVFAVSLVAYGALFIGDITQGVFAAFGTPQVIILSTVVAIAAALLVVSHQRERAGALS